MRIDRRTFLLSAAAAAGCSRPDNSAPPRKAAQWLWSRQSEDGGFHSATYGLLRSGQSLTPFVLDALLDVPEAVQPAPPGAVDRALAFIRAHTNADGSLGRMDPATDDYPNYATALAVTAFVKAGRPGWERDIAPMVQHLRLQQFTEDQGWKPADAPYGGWGMGGPIHRPPDAGHVDLSMTRYVLEALRDAGVPATDPAMTRSLAYLDRSRNQDGGFWFSPVNLETNKAGEGADGRPRSYGTATADGLIALRAAGLPDSDLRVAGAIKWLTDHHQPGRAPGFEPPYELWASGLRYYYAAAIKRAIPDLPVELPPQLEDGSFKNANNLVKEDDPLIATGFALRVLARP